jgi:class 3 adenylate cyclase
LKNEVQAEDEKTDTEKRQGQNRALLENVLPRHVADYFLDHQATNSELYHEQRDNAAIMFATITGFSQFYVELVR